MDAAIRYGPDGWPGVVSEYIAGREFVLIVARSLVEGRHRIAQPADIVGHTLLHHEGAPSAWRQWAAQHGVPEVQIVAGPRFAQYSALIQAALNGLGIGLVPKLLVQEELAEGLAAEPLRHAGEREPGALPLLPARPARPAGLRGVSRVAAGRGLKSRGVETEA